MNIRNAVFGAGLWAVAAGASALSLGASRGAVVLGGAVDLAFEVQPDPGTDLNSSCVTAALVSGDTPIGDAKVRVTPLPQMPGRAPTVRVQAAIAVDEPVLRVTLTAGCAGKTTRTYTFLSEFPSAVAPSASPVDVARLSQAVSAGSTPPRAPSAALATGTSAAAASPASPVAPQRSAPPAARAPAPARAAVRSSASPKPAAAVPALAARSRLVVEPLDTWLDSPMVLRSSLTLLAAPSDQPTAQRAEAAALWKSLNVQPQDIQQGVERTKALEADVATLRAQAARDRAATAQLQQQLEQAEQERFPAMVVYLLGGLLLLALLLAAWTWSRLRGASDKAVRAWRDSVALGAHDPVAAQDAALGLTPHPGDTWIASDSLPSPSGKAPLSEPATVQEPAVTTAAPRFSAPAPLVPPVAVPLTRPQPSPAPAPVVHIVNPEELFDVQQQAEFFISVGEHQQAIDVLAKHIAEHRETSPLAYLELLKLYHTLSRVDDFTQLRKQFMLSFNAQVPEFTGFHRTGRMLYHYTDALAEIEAEWTSISVLAVLEKFLFRRTGAEAVEPFDLAAYDDLLLLLSIAQTTPASARGKPAPRKRTTPLAPPPTEVVEAAVLSKEHPSLLDSLAASLEFDFDLPPSRVARSPQAPEAAAMQPGSMTGAHSGPLDLDLSEPLHITLSDLPPVPVTPPPPSGQSVGFGRDNDLVELRLELEQREAKPR